MYQYFVSYNHAATPLPGAIMKAWGHQASAHKSSPLATAVPEHRIAQSQAVDFVTDLFPSLAHLESIFANTGIETRHSCVPIDWFLEPHRWPDRSEVYQESAMNLLEEGGAQSDLGLGPGGLRHRRCRRSSQVRVLRFPVSMPVWPIVSGLKPMSKDCQSSALVVPAA